MRAREIVRTAVALLLRIFPVSVEPGLRIIGNPGDRSPVFITANFSLTVRRVSRCLKGLDCYLLVAPTGGINVWCAAKGGNFTAHSVISVVKTSRIGERVANRTLILPQLSAPGVDTILVRKETGWRCKFGPVYAKDIPEYISRGFKKNDEMLRVRWPFADRMDVGVGISSPMFLFILVILAIFLRSWIVEFALLYWGLFLFMYGCYPFVPGRAGWHKLLMMEGLIAAGLLGYVFLSAQTSWYVIDLFLMAIGLALAIGIDFGGVSPLYKSDLDPFLDRMLARLGIQQIGPVYVRGRATITRGRISLDEDNCTACGICYNVCPRAVFAIHADRHKRVTLDYPERCERCEACVLQCPRSAISVRA